MTDVRNAVLEFALSLPGAWEDQPWGETAVKVRAKVFAFLGGSNEPVLTVKLVESHAHALSIDGAHPTRYGLGKSGWVTLPLEAPELDDGLLRDWVEESYRIVAPKRLVAELDGSQLGR